MQLNTIKPAEGSKKNRRRVGRGIGSGLGKTAGRGHKGQKSRSGGFLEDGCRHRGNVHSVSQLLARLEMRHVFPWDMHRLAGLRVAAHARRPVVQAEAAEAGDLHLGTLEGPALHLLDLPYELDRDREIQR